MGAPSTGSGPAAASAGGVPADASEALGLLVRVEGRLVRASALPAPQPVDDLILERRGSVEPVRIPRGDVGRGVPWRPRSRLPRAERVVLGRPSGRLLRARAFYPDRGLTLVVHGRLPLFGPSRLHAGAQVQASAAGRTPFRIPVPRGTGRRLREAWVLEDLLPGGPFPDAEFQAAAPSLAEGLAAIWLPATSRRPIREVLTDAVVDSVRSLLDGPDSDYPDAAALLVAVESLRRRDDDLIVGLCHGDPVRSNWLWLPDDAPALVDWESAARRPIGHDLMKLVIALPNPRSIVAGVARLIPHGRKVAPIALQVAAPAAAAVAGWRFEREVADRTGRHEAYRRRIRQRLELLQELLG
jgi:hypothetical protein